MKIKAICYYYLPLNSSEGYSSYKILNFSSHIIEIFSQKDAKQWTYSLDDYEFNDVNYISTDNNWFHNVFNKIDMSKNDVLITRSMPNESHILGLKIFKFVKWIKWVAFFSDPFYNSPITQIENKQELQDLFKSGKYLMFLIRFIKINIYNCILKYKQNMIFKKANYLVFNNDYLMEYMLRNHDKFKSKAVILPHTYDATNPIYSKQNNLSNEKIKISFIGNLSLVRNLDNYIFAIKKILNDDQFNKDVQFIFVGCDQRLLEKNIDINLITHIHSVSYNDSLRIMAESDWLVNSDANIDLEKYIYMPCKLIDYCSFTCNILNISNFEHSPTVELVNKVGGINLLDNEQKILDYLKKIISEKRKKTNKSIYVEKYSNINVVKEFDNLINKLTNGEK